jgi:hypothetical protein
MKRWLLLLSISLSVFGVAGLLAQSVLSINGYHRLSKYQTYDPKRRPPLALPDAYALAVAKLPRVVTNRFHCISASVLEMSGSNGLTGWTFWFSNTNGDRASIWVFFDGLVTGAPLSGDAFLK